MARTRREPFGTFSACNASRPKPYGLSFRGKDAVFPLTLGRAALCRRLASCRFHWRELERIRIEIVSDFHADAARTLRKKRGFSVCSVAGSRSRDYQGDPHFQCGIALEHFPCETLCVAHHTAWRFAGKARFFRLVLAGRRSASTLQGRLIHAINEDAAAHTIPRRTACPHL